MDEATMAEKAARIYNETYEAGDAAALDSLKGAMYDDLGLAAYGPVSISGERLTFLRFRDRSWCCFAGWGQSPMKPMGVLEGPLGAAEQIEKSLWDEDARIDAIEAAIAKADGAVFHVSTAFGDGDPGEVEETRWYAFPDRSMLQVSVTFCTGSGPEACAVALMPSL